MYFICRVKKLKTNRFYEIFAVSFGYKSD